MAPPPPATLPLGQRLAALAQTLQFAWFAGHVTLLLASLRYGLSYITFNYSSKWATFTYRLGFLSACVTYGIVVYKAYRARARAGKQGGVVALATDENVQYLGEFSAIFSTIFGGVQATNAEKSWPSFGSSPAKSRSPFFPSLSTPSSMSQPMCAAT